MMEPRRIFGLVVLFFLYLWLVICPSKSRILWRCTKRYLKRTFHVLNIWFSSSAKKLIKGILDPNPSTRITIAEVLVNDWFKKGYKPPTFEHEEVTLDDVNSIFSEPAKSANHVVERREERIPTVPVTMNAFELISTSQGLNLSSLFEKQMGLVKRETRFTYKCPANEIISKIDQAAAPMGFDVKKINYKMKLHGEKSGRKCHLSITTEIFEESPSLHMLELCKAGGDTLEFHKFYKNLSTGLKDVVWKTDDEVKDDAMVQAAS